MFYLVTVYLKDCFRFFAALALAAAVSACALKEESPSNNTDLAEMEAGLPALNTLKRTSPHRVEITQVFGLPSRGPAQAGRAVTVAADGQVLLWTLPEGQPYQLLDLPVEGARFAFYEPRSLLAVVQGSVVQLLSLNTLRSVGTLDVLKTKLYAVQFSPDGRALLLGGADGRIYQWHFADQLLALRPSGGSRKKHIETYIGPAASISALTFHPLGRVFFSGDWLGGVNAWLVYRSDVFGGEYDENILGGRVFAGSSTRSGAGRSDSDAVDLLSITPDGEYVCLGSQLGALELWAVRALRRLDKVQAHAGPLYDLKLSPDGRRVATLARDSKLKLWDVEITADAGMPIKAALKLFREIEISGGRSVDFLDNSRLLLGTASGTLLEIKVKHES